MTGTVRENVQAWVEKGGIPLEFEVARVMAEAGFSDVAQSVGYRDDSPDGPKVREIDAVGSLVLGKHVSVHLVVECKHTTDPWLVLANRSILQTIDTIKASVAGEAARAVLARFLIESGADGVPTFLQAEPGPGFSVVVAHEKKPGSLRDDWDTARNAMSQAVSGAWATVSARTFSRTVAWPVVVIDGPLLKLSYDSAGEPQYEEPACSRILWRAGPFVSAVAIDIVQRSVFGDYAREARAGLQAIGQRLETEVRKQLDLANLDQAGHAPPDPRLP